MYGVDLIFLSELNSFGSDADQLMNYFKGEYCYYLNSEDKHDLEAPFTKNKTSGGTMIMWRTDMDPYVSIHPVSTTSFLPLIYSPPGSPITIHIALYLPTSGLESQFIEQITELRNIIDELLLTYPSSILFLRGDSNVNMNNKKRTFIFQNFCHELNLKNVDTNHKTYHHFVGQGLFDSSIDVILHAKSAPFAEEILDIVCQDDHPGVDSHHDIIISSVNLPIEPVQAPKLDNLLKAPRIDNKRVKIIWDDNKLSDYETGVCSQLERLRQCWPENNSPVSTSILLDLTNKVLHEVAVATQKSVSMNSPKKRKISKKVALAKVILNEAHKALKNAIKNNETNLESFTNNLKIARRNYRCITRKELHRDDLKRDSKLFSVFSPTKSKLFRSIRLSKTSAAASVPFLTVGEKTYPVDMVGDGLFESISELKKQDKASLKSSPNYASWLQDYRYILEICKHRRDIPPITLDQSNSILEDMKPTVSDFWSISPMHFRNAGEQGRIHFNFLMNRIISEVNCSSASELNVVLAQLLYKGHGKCKTSDRSYRTISTCPVIAKALDMYIHDLFIDLWNTDQADTQYQGQNSSHDLASLLLTEVTQHSKYTSKESLFMLFLDARSAFDTVVIEFLLRNLYISGMSGNSLLYLKDRLSSRITYCNWNGSTMGPIFDEHGLEQGGCNSGDLYKIYNNELLKTIQKSEQGVYLGNGLTISCVGQADDTCLLSNDIFKLSNILHLALTYCNQYKVDLCAPKTRLLMLSVQQDHMKPPINPISINGQVILPSQQAEHVGVKRSTEGNLHHLLDRVLVHKKARGALMSSGISRCHRGNPAASVTLEKLYALPVLLSGVPSLYLSKWDINIIDSSYKNSLLGLLKLYPGTPQAFIYFIAGSLPGAAIIHQRQLSLFNMICNLTQDPLNSRARYSLTNLSRKHRSWFTQIRDICLLYGLPHPLSLLDDPPSPVAFKKHCKSRILYYWESKLRAEVSSLSSLDYFHPAFHSLAKPHPVFWTAASNPYEVTKAVVQCRMLSGRYRTELLSSHWTQNKQGYCLQPTCSSTVETLEHMLLVCPAYKHERDDLLLLWKRSSDPTICQLLDSLLSGAPLKLLQFILDPSVHPRVITLAQEFGPDPLRIVFHLTRTWCYTIHRRRAKLLQRWP